MSGGEKGSTSHLSNIAEIRASFERKEYCSPPTDTPALRATASMVRPPAPLSRMTSSAASRIAFSSIFLARLTLVHFNKYVHIYNCNDFALLSPAGLSHDDKFSIGRRP